MSMISELVDRLRVEAKSMGTYGTDYMATLLMRSADTIEMLSEKARGESQADWYWRCPKCDHIVPNLYDECVWCLEPKPMKPKVVMPKKCKGCDFASKIIEAYSRGFEDGAEAVKAIKVKALHKDYIEPYVTIEDEPQTEVDWKDQMWTEAMRSCGFNVDGYRQGQPKTEPQTDIHGLTDCDFCKGKNCEDCESGKDEPQTERSE